MAAAKKTRKQIEDEIAALQADLESADDDDTELLVEHPTTKAVGRLRGRHAQSFLDSILGSVAKGSDDDQDDDPEPGPEPKAKRGRPAKPAPKRAPKPADDDDQDDDQDDDDPEPDPAPRSSVWGRG